jgi:hypothetical protein
LIVNRDRVLSSAPPLRFPRASVTRLTTFTS